MQKSAKSTLLGLMLAAVSVLTGSAETVQDTFEGGTAGQAPGAGWTGGVVSNQFGAAYAHTPPGYPVSGGHTKVLSVEGVASRTYSLTGDRVVDLMVLTEELPDEELAPGDGSEQVKLAFDTNGCINLYHKRPGASTAQWSTLNASDKFTCGVWTRITFLFNYAAGRVQLRVNGSPYESEYGYRAATGTDTPGTWYTLASSASQLTGIDFVGCGGVDDVVNADDTYVPAHAGATATATGIDYAWFNANGLPWSDGSETAPGGNRTVKQAFDEGTDPYSPNPLYVTNATYGLAKLQLTINGVGKVYSVEKSGVPFTDGTAGTAVTPESVVSDTAANTTVCTLPFPTDALTYYRVRNSGVATAETVNQFGVMRIDSSAPNTLVALPWKSLGPNASAPAAITAANVVMTNNLVNGDWLIYYDGGYKGWCLADGVWQPTATVEAEKVGGVAVSAAAASATLDRGQAIWVVRKVQTGRDLTKPFYLYGQHLAATSADNATVSSGGKLLASPNTTAAFDISAAGKITGAVAGDVIQLPAATDNVMPTRYEYKDGAWGYWAESTEVVGGRTLLVKTWTTTGLTIPAGRGFMYIPAESGGTRTINW